MVVLVEVSVLVLVAELGDEAVVLLLLLLLLESEAGVEAGVDAVVVELDELLDPEAGLVPPLGFTTVVLLVLPAGEAAGAAVSVFCSHAAKSAALARMQMYFIIGVWLSGPYWGTP